MICNRCRIWLPDHAKFCPTCGSPRSTFTPDRPPQAEPAPAPLPVPAPMPAPAPLPAPVPYSPTLHPDVAAVLQLQPGELALQLWRAGLTMPSNSDDDGPSQIGGVLVATNWRLCFLTEKGLLSKTYRLSESIPLQSLTSYAVGRFFRVKGLTLDIAGDRRTRRLEFANVFEVDPSTLKALTPASPEEFKANLDRLFGRAG